MTKLKFLLNNIIFIFVELFGIIQLVLNGTVYQKQDTTLVIAAYVTAIGAIIFGTIGLIITYSYNKEDNYND